MNDSSNPPVDIISANNSNTADHTSTSNASPSDSTAARAANLGQLLQHLASDFQQRTLDKCRQRGHHRIRGSHFGIATCLDERGQSIGELAARVGITQQATGKLLRDLEFGGYAHSATDDRDKRTRITRLTGAGISLQRDLAAILQEIRCEYGDLLGTQTLHSLERQLQDAVMALPHAIESAIATD